MKRLRLQSERPINGDQLIGDLRTGSLSVCLKATIGTRGYAGVLVWALQHFICSHLSHYLIFLLFRPDDTGTMRICRRRPMRCPLRTLRLQCDPVALDLYHRKFPCKLFHLFQLFQFIQVYIFTMNKFSISIQLSGTGKNHHQEAFCRGGFFPCEPWIHSPFHLSAVKQKLRDFNPRSSLA